MVFDISGLLSLRVIMIAQGPTSGALAGSAASSANSSLRPDRLDFDGAVFAERELLGPLDGFVLRLALDQVEAAENLLRLREGAVGHLPLSRCEPYAAALLVRAQTLGEDHLAFAGGLQVGLEPLMATEERLHIGLLERGRGPVDVDEQQIAHRPLLTR